jgi:uncharacterized protein (TIGR02001 family)
MYRISFLNVTNILAILLLNGGIMKKIGSLFFFFIFLLSIIVSAQSKPEVNAGADVVSRYVWRGMDFGSAPSIQPSLSLGIVGFEVGFWGAYTFSNNNQTSDELDAWFSYTYSIENSISFSAIVTDYYFPNAGTRIGNFNNYDNPDGAGAHILEVGLSVGGAEAFPLTLSGYINVYNDAGNNTYFQLDYPFTVNDVDLNFQVGASGGSKDNPAYYNTDTFNVINVGLTASKEIKITDDFSLPVFVSYIINPRVEMSHLVFGISL